jgi:hypothetical protein
MGQSDSWSVIGLIGRRTYGTGLAGSEMYSSKPVSRGGLKLSLLSGCRYSRVGKL